MINNKNVIQAADDLLTVKIDASKFLLALDDVNLTIKVPKGYTWQEFIDSEYNIPIDITGKHINDNLVSCKFTSYTTNANQWAYNDVFQAIRILVLSAYDNTWRTEPYDVWYNDGVDHNASNPGIPGQDAVQANDVINKTLYYLVYDLCFSIDSLITLADNSTKLAKDIDYDDCLLVWDFDNGQFSSAKPLWIQKIRVASHYYKLTFDDGTILKLVGSEDKCHEVFNVDRSNFEYGSYWNMGEKGFTDTQQTPSLVSIEKIDEPIEYVNIITKYHINCFVNHLLTSCRYNKIYPIEDMKFVKDDRQIIPFEDYNVPKQYYDGMRLGEQNYDIDKTNRYIANLISTAKQ